MSSDINVESLVEKSRYPKTVNEILGLIVYFPFGLILVFMRVFVSLHAICISLILSKISFLRRPLLRYVCCILGLIMIEKKNSAPKSSRVLVSNYLSIFDHIPLHLGTGVLSPSKVFNGPLGKFFGVVSSLPQGIVATEAFVLKQLISDESDDKSLVLFPEGASTNGKTALLKFSTLPAVVSDKLQPVVITIERPSFANISMSVLGATNYMEIFWFFFVPYTTYEYKLLEVIERSEGESNETLMARVELAISKELNISTSNITKNDKEEYTKKYFLELAENARNQNKSTSIDNFDEDPEILRMAAQVSDVLPYVPQNAIVANLRRTRSVDITITNLLDGTVKYTPLAKSSKELKPKTTKTEPNNFGVGSFMDRKAKLIDEARKKYIKKHNLHHLVQ